MTTEADVGRIFVRHKKTRARVAWYPTHNAGEKRVRLDVFDDLENYEVVDAKGVALPDWIIHYS